MAMSIQQLRIYQTARGLEDRIYELVKQFPGDDYYDLGNDLRRSSAAVSHHIMEAYRLVSYRLKLDSLDAMRREAMTTKEHIKAAERLGVDQGLIEGYADLAKLSLGLSEWLRSKLEQKLRKTCKHLDFTDTLDGHKCTACGLEWTEEDQARIDAA